MADMALDATVAANIQAKRDGRRRDRDQRAGYGQRSNYFGGGSSYRPSGGVGKYRTDDRGYGQRTSRGAGGDRDEDQSTKVLISNLDFNVSDVDVKELFCEFGKTRKLRLNYDKSGRSLGTAEVVYEKRSDAYRAMQQYNGVPLDGKPMIIEIVGAPPQRPAAPAMASRHYSRPVPYGSRNYALNQPSYNTGPRTSRRDGDSRIEKTAEELDKELDQYLQSAGRTESEEKETTSVPEPEKESPLADELEQVAVNGDAVEAEAPASSITEEEEKDILDADD